MRRTDYAQKKKMRSEKETVGEVSFVNLSTVLVLKQYLSFVIVPRKMELFVRLVQKKIVFVP